MKKMKLWEQIVLLVLCVTAAVTVGKKAYRDHIYKMAKEEWAGYLSDNEEYFDYLADTLTSLSSENRITHIELLDPVLIHEMQLESIPEYDKLEEAFEKIKKVGVNYIIHSNGGWVFVNHNYKSLEDAKKKDGALHDEGIYYPGMSVPDEKWRIYGNRYFVYSDYKNDLSWINTWFGEYKDAYQTSEF